MRRSSPGIAPETSSEQPSIERLERALAIVSYAIVQDGPIYEPLLQRIEAEIAARRAGDDVISRAKRNIERLRDQAASKCCPIQHLAQLGNT